MVRRRPLLPTVCPAGYPRAAGGAPLSAFTYVIVLSNAVVWVYRAGLINGPAAILILHRLMNARYKRRIKSQIALGSAARSLACARQPVHR